MYLVLLLRLEIHFLHVHVPADNTYMYFHEKSNLIDHGIKLVF